MEECEICGKPTDTIYIVEIEGAEMHACESCAKGKKLIEKISEFKSAPQTRRKTVQEDKELVDNYGELIRKAREQLEMPLKVLAERINEKESMLLRVEEQKMLPSDELARKLERELGIKLIMPQKIDEQKPVIRRDAPITLGDAVMKKNKK